MKAKKENFATRLNHLFEVKRKLDGSQYSQTEVIEGTNGVLNRVYLWKLRTGRASNPSLQMIQALAGFFGVEPSYFFEGEDARIDLTQEREKRDQLVDQIALRSSELDNAGKQAVLYMIESIMKSKK
jgi:transcriptional regulator with XRE-family HTH domain